jgi:exodeoxyribonuclease-3
MKVSTWNVNGIRARETQLLDWLLLERPDVLCLQEIKASPDQIPETLRDLPGYWGRWHGGKGYSGVSLHLRRDRFPEPTFGHPGFDHENRVVTADVGDVTFASIYVPNGNKDYRAKIGFLEGLDAWVAAAHAGGRRLVVCGDLNVARTDRDVHPKLRKPTEIGQTDEERALLERILARGLGDLLRHHDPDNDRLFTWWAPWRSLRERNIGWRLDYVLASTPVAERSTGCRAFREFGSSDHGPVNATFDLPAVTPPPGPA